jgi:hypothetical protein
VDQNAPGTLGNDQAKAGNNAAVAGLLRSIKSQEPERQAIFRTL